MLRILERGVLCSGMSRSWRNTWQSRKIINLKIWFFITPFSRHNETLGTKKSMTWFTHQECQDMFILSKWNQSISYDFAIKRDFGTDYGICCWYTPQINFTEIDIHTKENNLKEPDWGQWFMDVPKVRIIHNHNKSIDVGFFRVQKRVKTTGSPCYLISSHLTIPTTMRAQRAWSWHLFTT